MERLIRGAENIAQLLGISVRTLKRRLESQWKEGFGFFKDESGYWCIRESNLEHLISAMEHGWLSRKGTPKQDTEQ
ncbi:MAG: hypothetical protein K2L50_07370 [Bacteroidales bacterium]|nr:hypothetical protein [Bacteroidales bacterium]